MPLWCQNDPVVRVSKANETAILRIVTRAQFADENHMAGEDDEVLLSLTTPQSTKAVVVKEFQVPELPQVFDMQESTKLKVTGQQAQCELDIELSSDLDPENRGDCLEVVVSVTDRHGALLTEKHFKPDGDDNGMGMLSFVATLEPHDHTDDVVNMHTSTWS